MSIIDTVVYRKKIDGVDEVDIYNTSKKNIVIVYCNKDEAEFREYYNYVKSCLKGGSRVIFVIVGEASEQAKQICYMLIRYDNFDIYKVGSEVIVTAEYIDKVISRKSSIYEVQEYVSSDISAYADILEVIMDVAKYASENKLDKIAEILKDRDKTLEKSAGVVEYIKKVAERVITGEAGFELTELKGMYDSLEREVENSKIVEEKALDELSSAVNELEAVKRENSKTKIKIEELERIGSNISSDNMISHYREINTQVINCKVKSVVYFKEITGIPYIKTLISELMNSCKQKELKHKLVIYDRKCISNVCYGNIPIVSSREFKANHSEIVTQYERVVVVEPNQAIISDILTEISCPCDVVIIVDRLCEKEDIVIGNNVYKYWVVNTENDLKSLTESGVRVEDQNVITRTDENRGGKYMDIPDVEEFRDASPAFKSKKYRELKSVSGVNILKSIENRAYIDRI